MGREFRGWGYWGCAPAEPPPPPPPPKVRLFKVCTYTLILLGHGLYIVFIMDILRSYGLCPLRSIVGTCLAYGHCVANIWSLCGRSQLYYHRLLTTVVGLYTFLDLRVNCQNLSGLSILPVFVHKCIIWPMSAAHGWSLSTYLHHMPMSGSVYYMVFIWSF